MKASRSRGRSSTAIGGNSGREARSAAAATRPYGVVAERHPKPPAWSVISGPDASVLQRHDELPATAAAYRGGVPGGGRGLEGRRAPSAAGLHAPPHARGLR